MAAVVASERYRTLDKVGDGGVGVVYRVEDRVTGELRAMKVIPRATGVSALRGEFLALARLQHDNIVVVHDYGLTEAGHDFFTMEFVEGAPLLTAVTGADHPAFFPVVGGMLRALAFLHARGMVHADIKPSNILIDGATIDTDPISAVKLVDFGLAAAVADPNASAARGTFPYAAPEVYAGRLDARSDLYAVGVVLYELVCRVKPFPGDDVATILAAQRRSPPADPRSLRPGTSDGLAELILQLLDPIPGARPQTADEVLARINEIAGTDFAIADTRPLVDVSGVLIGRDRDLRDLQELWTDASAGLGSVALVSGEEGIGKSRLLTELKLQVQLAGGRALSVSQAELPTLDRTLRAVLGAPTPPAEQPLEHESRYAVAESLARLLLEVATHQPLLLVIDDVHRSAPGTAELLSYLARAAPGGAVLLVLAAQDENLAQGGSGRLPTTESPPSLARSPYAQQPGTNGDAVVTRVAAAVTAAERGRRIDLAPLDRHSTFRMIECAFDSEVARALAAEVHRAAGGNPAHARRVLQALVDSDGLRRHRGRWQVAELTSPLPMPDDAIASARSRAATLSASARAILDTAAVLGEHFDRRTLTELSGDAAAVESALAEATAARLVRGDIGTGRFQFAHREVAAALYANVEAATRDRLHQQAADSLVERSNDVPPEVLATHYLAIGDAKNSATWSMRAAQAHAEARDHHGALHWYERARPLVKHSPALSSEVDERTGDLRAVIGDASCACQDYERAYATVGTGDAPQAHIRIARKWSSLLRKRGDSDGAQSLLMTALAAARRTRLPREEALCQLSLGEVAMYRAEYKAAMEHAVAGQLLARAGSDRALAADLGRLRASIDVYQGDAAAALEHLTESAADAESTADEAIIAEVLFATGRAAIHAGDYPKAVTAYARAVPMFERAGRVEQVARSVNNMGAAAYFSGDWPRARESWERFRDLCVRLDDKAELVNALNNLGTLYLNLGQLDQASATLNRGAEIAAFVGHAHMAAMILGNRGDLRLQRDDLSGARECYEQALAQFRDIGARQDVVENLRRLCELDLAVGCSNEALDRAIDTAREAKHCGARLEEGILHRVAATALRQQGDLEGADWFCQRARHQLDELGARFELAKVDVEAAEIAAVRDDTEQADGLLNAAIDTFADLGARGYLKLARDRHRRLVGDSNSGTISAAGRDVLLEVARAAGQLELDKLLEKVLDKILQVTDFERGFILLLGRDGRPSERMRRTRPDATAFGATDVEFSGSIVRRVAAGGEAVAVADVADSDLRDQTSVIALGLRRVMCAPMRWRDRIVGVAYVDSQDLPRDNREMDLALFEALATQAGLAIENARLRAEDRRKTELMGVLAHEIRNPLSGILGFSKPTDAERSTMSEHALTLLQHINRDGQRLKRLVDNVMELTRYETGAADWSMAPFDLRTLLEQTRPSFAATAAHRTITIELELDEAAPHALGNPDRIAQVLSNLVGNAIKFSPDGGVVTIKLRGERVRDDDPDAPPAPPTDLAAWAPLPGEPGARDYLRVDVIDRGPGMDDDIRQTLFEKFKQGQQRRSKGIGLGLYISREIVERHNGTIWVTSAPGEGSTFSFRIPAVP